MGRRTNSSRNDRSGRGGGMRRDSGGGGSSRGERNGTGRPATGESGGRERTGTKSGGGASHRDSNDRFGGSGPDRDTRGGYGSRRPAQADPYTGLDRGESVRAKKALGQHFLTDLNIAKRICDSLAVCGAVPSGSEGATDSSLPEARTPEASAAICPRTVLEVGCGMGVLTQFLLKREDITLYGAEIDPESVAYLHEHFPDFTPRLMEGDFLKMNLPELFPDGLRVIGNFPYNISSQIFFKALANRDMVPEVVGMIQREVAVRIAEPPGSREYGILSVLLQTWYDIEYLFTVSEGVFNPPPKVKSAVIRLRRNDVKSLDCDEKLFVQVVKASFGQRRKMLRNALRAVFGDFGGAEHAFFSTRAEQLSVADFVELTRWVAEHK